MVKKFAIATLLLVVGCQQPSAQPTAPPPPPPPTVAPAVSPSPVAKPAPSPAVSPAASPIALPPEVVVTANREDRTLSVVDPIATRVLATVALDRPPHAVAIAADERSAFATDPSETSRSVVFADLPTARQVGDVTVGARPDGIASANTTGEVVVANSGDNSVSTFVPTSRAPSSPIQVGNTPRGVAIAAVEGRSTAFVANSADGSVSVVDLAQRRVAATVNVGGQPIAVATSIDGSRAYALDAQGGNVAVIDTRANQVTTTIRGGDHLTGLDTTADGRFLLVTADDATHNLYKVDLNTNQPARDFNVGAGALAVAASPRAARAYITTTDNRLVVWDTAGDRVTGTVPVGRRPEGVAVQVQPAPPATVSPSPAVSPAPAIGSPSPATKPQATPTP